MRQEKQIHIADTNHGTILLSNLEKEVISTKLFNRLHHVSQNSTVYLTFPSNKTKRFEHSIGTMKLCGDMFYNAVCNTSEKDLDGMFNKIQSFISDNIEKGIKSNDGESSGITYQKILGNRYFDEDGFNPAELANVGLDNVFYNMYFPQNIKGDFRFIYLIVFQAVRLCGLLHDIGHPPFSHVVESSMKTIYKEVKEKNAKNEELTDRERSYLNIFDDLYDKAAKNKTLENDKNNNQLHEIMGNEMVKNLMSGLLFSQNVESECDDANCIKNYFRVLTFGLVKHIFANNLTFLHDIISGPIDGDRLDYVNRDITNSGLNNGKIEYERLLSSCKFLEDNKSDNNSSGYVLAFYIKTVNTIDDFLRKRWFLYKNIVYHHRVVKTDELMKSCIKDIIRAYLVSPDKDSKNKQANPSRKPNYLLPNDISGLWKAIKFSYSQKKLFDYLIQWDDNWLLTTLKKYYFEKYYFDNCSTAYKLEELLSNKKNYHSLIKNHNDFSIFNEEFEIYFKNNCPDVYEAYIKMRESYPLVNKSNHGLFFFLKINSLNDNIENMDEIIEASLNDFIAHKYGNKIEDHFLVCKEPKDGLTTQPFIYNSTDFFELFKFSNIKLIFELEKQNYPYFYIYIKFKKGVEESVKDMQNVFLKEFAVFAAKKIETILYKKGDTDGRHFSK